MRCWTNLIESNRAMYFAEFFAGVGLVNLAISPSGWECRWANDISAEKQRTYEKNFGSKHFALGDIWDYVNTPSSIPEECFLYTASFPCTDMSLAGERRGLAGEESGTLNAVLRIIEKKKLVGTHPYLVMLENVQGFLTSHGGADVEATISEFNRLGYVVDVVELDAIHFSPQSRPRVFLFAVREEIASEVMDVRGGESVLDPWWSHFESNPLLRTEKIRRILEGRPDLKVGAFTIPKPPRRKEALNDIIEVNLNEIGAAWWSQSRKDHLYSQMSDLHKAVLNKMISKTDYVYGTVYRRTRNGKPFAELRTDGVAGCLRTPRGGSSKQILIRAGKGDWAVRLLTPREYARLQGVDDSFKLPDNENQGYFAMGDAVCVPAVEFLSRHVLTPTYELVTRRRKSGVAHLTTR